MKTKNVNFRRIVRSAPSFAEAIDSLMKEGMTRGKALLLARKHDAEGYNCWMRHRQRTGNMEQGSGSIMQHFRFIGG